jgi:transcription initiation factor TFIIH subunit 4
MIRTKVKMDDYVCWMPALCQVYAYTSSPIQTSILSLFTRQECLLPNLFVGTLTRESVMAALDAGINGRQITKYLQQHAHPQVAKNTPVVPVVSGHPGQLRVEG